MLLRQPKWASVSRAKPMTASENRRLFPVPNAHQSSARPATLLSTHTTPPTPDNPVHRRAPHQLRTLLWYASNAQDLAVCMRGQNDGAAAASAAGRWTDTPLQHSHRQLLAAINGTSRLRAPHRSMESLYGRTTEEAIEWLRCGVLGANHEAEGQLLRDAHLATC
jgi:hypothetical protein